ncbi:hypothetical protein [Tolypothrix sp. VBCCA 56010]
MTSFGRTAKPIPIAHCDRAHCPIPNDARCFKSGNPPNALAPQCPMPIAH